MLESLRRPRLFLRLDLSNGARPSGVAQGYLCGASQGCLVSKGWEPAGSTWVQLEWLGRSKTPHRHTLETHKRRILKEAKGLVAVASQGVPVFMPS